MAVYLMMLTRGLCLSFLVFLGNPLVSAETIWSWDGTPESDYRPFMSPITATVKANLVSIAAQGQNNQRVLGRMGQIGDSITVSSTYFRNVVGGGPSANETLHDYRPIRSWLAYGGTKAADFNSFYRQHGKGVDYGNNSGWRLYNAVQAGHPIHAVDIGDGEVPGHFSWALIMFGSNDIDDAAWTPQAWGAALTRFCEGFIALGVIPVLSTIPPEQAHVRDGRVEAANVAVRAVANTLRIAYVDYYSLILHAQPVNWVGTLISSDGTHPSAGGGGRDFSNAGLTQSSGYSARSKLTLDVAEKLKAIVFEDGPAEPPSMRLQQGFNWISFPRDPTISSFDLHHLLGPSLRSIVRFDEDAQRHQTDYVDGRAQGANFRIVAGEGYVLNLAAAHDLALTGIPSTTVHNLQVGHNLVGFSDVPPGLTAGRLLTLIGPANVAVSISRFDPVTDRFETAVQSDNGVAGSMFPIKVGEAYAVRLLEAVSDFRLSESLP